MDEETRRARVRAEAIQLAIDQRRQASSGPITGEIEVAPQLRREAARVALEILSEEGSGLTDLLDRMEELGKLRAAVQLLQEAGLTAAAETADRRFFEAWKGIKETDPKFFDKYPDELLGRLEAVVQLLRQAASEDAQTTN
jgi:hypothetical protein